MKITRKDRAIIATFIQWLGSNVGYSFLEATLRKCGLEIIKSETLQKMRADVAELKSKAVSTK